MNKKYIVPIALITSMTILQSPAYSQLDMPQVGAVRNLVFNRMQIPHPHGEANLGYQYDKRLGTRN